MLRLSAVGLRNSQSFICQRCLRKLNAPPLGALPSTKRISSRLLSISGVRTASVNDAPLSFIATNEGPISARTPPPNFDALNSFLEQKNKAEGASNAASDVLAATPDIRQTLAEWDDENRASFPVPPKDQGASADGVGNGLMMPAGFEVFRVESSEDVDPDIQVWDHDDLVDMGHRRKFLRPGDLVELTNKGRSQFELAIFVQDVGVQSQFYMISGKCINALSPKVMFYVPDFIEVEELNQLLPYLPDSDVAEKLQNLLIPPKYVIPRNISKSVLQKLLRFKAETETVYQAAAFRLDRAHELVAHEDKMTHATLQEIAEQVLPPTFKRTKQGEYEKHVLYAVHRALSLNDVGFRPHGEFSSVRAGGQYEISSKREIQVLAKVMGAVREQQEVEVARSQGAALPDSYLAKFAEKARHLIDRSRQDRDLTQHGTLSPWKSKYHIDQHGDILRTGQICHDSDHHKMEEHAEFIEFMELWAGLTTFSTVSRLNGVGSMILRSIGRYDDFALNQKTAWTFLQEIGSIPPWATRAPYEFRMLDTGRVLSWSTVNSNAAKDAVKDRLTDLRKVCESSHVYCIDDLNAMEIDDGISLEATDTPDQYWVHVHVADPAAHMAPGSQIANRAEASIATHYSPDRVLTMMPKQFSDQLSLGNGRPCLTFSALMNMDGVILDYKITPDRLRNVINIIPRTVYELTSSNGALPGREMYEVGPALPYANPSRKIHDAQQLLDVHKDEINVLFKLGSARSRQWAKQGGVMGTTPEPTVRVSFGGAPWAKPALSHSLRYPGDPTIRVDIPEYDPTETHYLVDESQFVRNLMLLAGEVAGRWCAARGIPVPFRVTPHTGRNPYEFFVQNVLPTQNESGQFDSKRTTEYSRMIGRVQMSSISGRHAQLGVDSMAKCTSPLRRYGDLLLQWQVEAALLEEARLGHSLVGNTRDDFLPFSKGQVDAILPRLDAMERLIRRTQGHSSRQWVCHFLVRAWRYKEAQLPATWPFLVKGMAPEEDRLVGHVPNLNMSADCTIPMWSKSVQKGDLLNVEIEDVDVYNMRLRVKALGFLQ